VTEPSAFPSRKSWDALNKALVSEFFSTNEKENAKYSLSISHSDVSAT
jgi:hypothetical protein